MSEVIISRRGQAAGSIPADAELVTLQIDANQEWVVPYHFGNISVRLFGGGSGQGGSGYMNNSDLNIKKGEKIQINIGIAGNRSGGTTSFGPYLSANGGSGANGGAGGTGYGYSGNGGIGYQFGGGGGYGNSKKSGSGGMWGGGGGGAGGPNSIPGVGGQYGGGGGGGAYANEYWWSGDDSDDEYHYAYALNGANGGQYGGGGGGGVAIIYDNKINKAIGIGCGGTYGGNGGYSGAPAKNGINTIGLEGVPSNLQGNGITNTNILNICIKKYNNGMKEVLSTWYADINIFGGGGYGSKGIQGIAGCTSVRHPWISSSYSVSGNRININICNNSTYSTYMWRHVFAAGGGGGGGYGSKGGNPWIWINCDNSGGARTHDSRANPSGGGGGGYGGNGANGSIDVGGGGGGYFADGVKGGGGGYYNYAHGGYHNIEANSWGPGSGGWANKNARNGVCIIQYYG